MIRWIVGALLSPLIHLGEQFLTAQTKREALRAGVERAAMSADATVRRVKLSYLLGRVPLFLAELAAALYFSAIMIDSTFPMAWLTPLELPRWFQPHFHWALASIFGISTLERLRKK